MKNNTKNAGFTLIETLVAITILMVSVVGPLTIASKGLTAAANSRDQVIASYLAQDLMEYLQNVRDSDLLNPSAGWSGSSGSFIDSFSSCTSASPCGVETAAGVGAPQGLVSCQTNSCRIYQETYGSFYYYTYVGAGNITSPFSRSFYVTSLSASSALLTVIVTWKEGNALASQVVLKSVLFNTTR